MFCWFLLDVVEVDFTTYYIYQQHWRERPQAGVYASVSRSNGKVKMIFLLPVSEEVRQNLREQFDFDVAHPRGA